MTLHIVQDEVADEVLSTNAFALLCGMLLQQQVSLDVAFAGPAKLLDRFGSLDPTSIAEAPPEEFAELFASEPAIHPYPESMSVLAQALAEFIVVNYGGDTAALWKTAESGEFLLSRLILLPGFNKRKSQMFVALLGKQLDVQPDGWERAAGPYAQHGTFRSVADVRDPESLDKVRNAPSARSTSQDGEGDVQQPDGKSGAHQESKGQGHVNTEVEPEQPTQVDEDEAEPKGGRKKAAKRAANKERRAALAASDPEAAAAMQEKRAAKRAARRAGDADGGEGAGKRGGNKGRGGRNRAEGDRTATDAAAGDAASTDNDA